MSLSKEVAAAVIVLDECGVFVKKKRKNRELWAKSWLLNRKRFSHMNLLDFIRSDRPEDYQNYLRMTHENYDVLLQKVKPFITKQDTTMRNAITPEERLTATLRFLATGRSFEDLKFSTIISPQALGRIIPETCKAIYKSLKGEFLKVRMRFSISHTHNRSSKYFVSTFYFHKNLYTKIIFDFKNFIHLYSKFYYIILLFCIVIH